MVLWLIGMATLISQPATITLGDIRSPTAKLSPVVVSSTKFENPGATPSISANGNKNAIVWAIATKTWNGTDTKPAVLYAFDATKLGNPCTRRSKTASVTALP